MGCFHRTGSREKKRGKKDNETAKTPSKKNEEAGQTIEGGEAKPTRSTPGRPSQKPPKKPGLNKQQQKLETGK